MSFCVSVLESCASKIKCFLFCQQVLARFYFNPVVYRVACHWSLMGLEASNCCYLDYGVKNLTNLIDCSFVLSSFFWNGCFITFMCSKPNTFGTSSVLRFMVLSNHTLCFTLLRIFMMSDASHINKSDKHVFIHYRKLTRSMFLSKTLPAPV